MKENSSNDLFGYDLIELDLKGDSFFSYLEFGLGEPVNCQEFGFIFFFIYLFAVGIDLLRVIPTGC